MKRLLRTAKQLNLVAVRVGDKGQDGGAVFHGTRFPHNTAASGPDFVAGRIDVVDTYGDMAVTLAQLVTVGSTI